MENFHGPCEHDQISELSGFTPHRLSALITLVCFWLIAMLVRPFGIQLLS